MIRTAVPFGYLFIYLVLAGVLLVGAGLLIWGCLIRKRGPVILGVLTMLGVCAIILGDIAFESSLEWNPTIAEDSLVVGLWNGKHETVNLRSDHTVIYKSKAKAVTGTWTRRDWNLWLTTDDVYKSMRFILFRGSLRLMTNPPDDPDMWDGDLGLTRQ